MGRLQNEHKALAKQLQGRQSKGVDLNARLQLCGKVSQALSPVARMRGADML